MDRAEDKIVTQTMSLGFSVGYLSMLGPINAMYCCTQLVHIHIKVQSSFHVKIGSKMKNELFSH